MSALESLPDEKLVNRAYDNILALGYEPHTVLYSPSTLLIHDPDTEPLIPGFQTDSEELRTTHPDDPRVAAADRAARIRGILQFIYDNNVVITQTPRRLAEQAGLPYHSEVVSYLIRMPDYS